MKLIPYSVTRSIGRTVLKTKKNSPHIFFVGGIAGVVGSTVLACRATLKLDKNLDEIRNEIHSVKEVAKQAESDETSDYTEHEYYRDLGHIYLKSVVRLGRLYGPSILLGTASIGALTGSHVQLTRRNAALTATLAAVTKAYEEYRIRIQEEIGKEKEFEIYHGITDEKGEDGKKLKVVNTGTGYSMYAKIFDETNPNWTKSVEHNRVFLDMHCRYMNHLLNSRGHVLLNDVYDQLGFERTPAGCVVGWLLGGGGDDFVDFGLFEASASRFINGQERSVILDFNVDGNIYELI